MCDLNGIGPPLPSALPPPKGETRGKKKDLCLHFTAMLLKCLLRRAASRDGVFEQYTAPGREKGGEQTQSGEQR